MKQKKSLMWNPWASYGRRRGGGSGSALEPAGPLAGPLQSTNRLPDRSVSGCSTSPQTASLWILRAIYPVYNQKIIAPAASMDLLTAALPLQQPNGVLRRREETHRSHRCSKHTAGLWGLGCDSSFIWLKVILPLYPICCAIAEVLQCQAN